MNTMTATLLVNKSSANGGDCRKKKPYKELTLEEKVQLIRLASQNPGMSQASMAEKYEIAKSNVCRILQRKHEYLRAFESASFSGSRKRKLRSDTDITATIESSRIVPTSESDYEADRSGTNYNNRIFTSLLYSSMEFFCDSAACFVFVNLFHSLTR